MNYRMENYNYHMDRRTWGPSNRGKFNETKMTLSIEMEDEEGELIEITLPAKFEVCDRCNGTGTMVNPNIDAGGITQDEWNQWDPDEQDAYQAGAYDVCCSECGGKRVTPIIDEGRLNDKQKEQFKLYCDWQRDEAEYAWLSAQERAMGA